ncbi:MAG: hypothetical protein IT581_06415 [Verrucomicrobiales bacterium]|nr:hypothetical protein [Verrucomicrobiales bacterium]
MAKFNNTLKEQVARLSRSQTLWDKSGRNVSVLIFDEKTGQISALPDSLKKFCSDVAGKDDQALKETLERYRRAYPYAGSSVTNEAQMRALNSMRIITIENFARVLSTWRAMFFENVTLGPDERPVYKHSYKNEIDVYTGSQDGGMKRTKAVKPQKEVYPELYEKRVGPVTYRLRDILQGDIGQAAQATFDLAADKNEVDDLDHYNALATCFGAFTTTGAKIDRTYIAGRNVRSGVLPTTNELDTPSLTGSTKFKVETIIEAINYQTRFGKVLGGQPLRLTGVIIIPADEATGITAQFSPTSNYSNPTSDGIIQDFMSFPYMGTTWTLVPDLYIPAGKCIFQTDRKVGHSYEKPSWDSDVVTPSDPAERILQNREERTLAYARGISIPAPWKAHVVRVRFHS